MSDQENQNLSNNINGKFPNSLVSSLLQQNYNQLKNKYDCQKLFMDMVIHDLRNPAESIYQGLNQAKVIINQE